MSVPLSGCNLQQLRRHSPDNASTAVPPTGFPLRLRKRLLITKSADVCTSASCGIEAMRNEIAGSSPRQRRAPRKRARPHKELKIYDCEWDSYKPEHIEAQSSAADVGISVAPASGIVNRIFYQFSTQPRESWGRCLQIVQIKSRLNKIKEKGTVRKITIAISSSRQ